jgi:rod shape-determining protein MreC
MWSSANYIVATSNNIQTSIAEYFNLRKDNAILAEENAVLKQQLMELENAKEYHIERDSQYIYSHLEWEYIPAKVIDISTDKQHNYLTINKGTRDGIEQDMGVIGKDGVVGIVSAVSDKYALVVPIIHTKISISSRLKSNNQIGGTSWKGRDYRYVQLTDIARHVEVHQGDTVVTSGLTDVFPGGLIIGTVSETELGLGDNYHQTIVELSTDYKSLKYVQVIGNKNSKMTDKIEQNHGMD